MRGADLEQTCQRERAELLLASARMALTSTDPLPSPCTSVCRMSGDTGLCEGCFRTLDEIVAWSRIGDEGENGKRRIWSNISQRAQLALG
jgi:uncharacterized protein